jgi:hypothetical protein
VQSEAVAGEEGLMLYAIAFIIGLLYGIVLTLGVFLPRKPQGRVIERLDPRRPW